MRRSLPRCTVGAWLHGRHCRGMRVFVHQIPDHKHNAPRSHIGLLESTEKLGGRRDFPASRAGSGAARQRKLKSCPVKIPRERPPGPQRPAFSVPQTFASWLRPAATFLGSLDFVEGPVSDSIDGNKHHRDNEPQNRCKEQGLRAEIFSSRCHVVSRCGTPL